MPDNVSESDSPRRRAPFLPRGANGLAGRHRHLGLEPAQGSRHIEGMEINRKTLAVGAIGLGAAGMGWGFANGWLTPSRLLLSVVGYGGAGLIGFGVVVGVGVLVDWWREGRSMEGESARAATPAWPAKIPLRSAVDLILSGLEPRYPGETQADAAMDVLGALAQEAAYGHIRVWGKPRLIGALEIVDAPTNATEIPKSHWANHVIDEIRFLGDGDGRTRTAHYGEEDSFRSLTFDRDEIEAFKRTWLGQR